MRDEVFQHGIQASSSRVWAPTTYIPLHVIILTYISSYGVAHIAPTSGGGALIGT
jgi:hypothetical protein